MNPKTTLLLAGGLGAIALTAIALKGGSTTTQGVVFQAPDPASVAAITSAGANEIASVNALAVQRSQIAANLLTALDTNQQQLTLGAMAAHSTDLKTAAQTTQVGIQSGAATAVAALSAQTADYLGQVGAIATENQSNNAVATANLTTQAQIQTANATAASQTAVAQAASDAAKPSFWSALSSVAGAVTAAFGGGKKAP